MNNIRYAKISDVEKIKAIVDEAISVDYYSENDLIEFVNNEHNLFFIYTDDKDEPIACLLCEKGNLSDICINNKIPESYVYNDIYNESSTAIIYKTAATRSEDRNNGILAEFLSLAEEVTKDIDHDLKICLCLILPSEKIPVHRNVINNGFKQVKRVKSPWSDINSYCSYCNSQYCKCDGMIYIKGEAK